MLTVTRMSRLCAKDTKCSRKRNNVWATAGNMHNTVYTDKKEYQILLIYKEIPNGAVAKSYMRKDFLIYEEMRKYIFNHL